MKFVKQQKHLKQHYDLNHLSSLFQPFKIKVISSKYLLIRGNTRIHRETIITFPMPHLPHITQRIFELLTWTTNEIQMKQLNISNIFNFAFPIKGEIS